MDKEKCKIKSVATILGILLLFLFLSSFISAEIPHPICGYAYYEDTSHPAAGSTVILINENRGEKIYTIVDEFGYYSVNVGTPGPGWESGEKVIVMVNGTGDYKGWKGNASFIVDLDQLFQQVDDIILQPMLMANFSYFPSNPTDLDEINFIDESHGRVINWTWDFGDGNISYGKNPVHQYFDDGNYSITLTIEDENGTIDKISKYINVANVLPNAIFTWSPTSPTTQDIIQFVDTSFDIDGTIVSWYWEFGDGNTSSQQNPAHRYGDDGTYTVALTVEDDDGDIGKIMMNMTILNIPPIAIFSYSTNNLTINVDASDSFDPDGKLIKYEWKWDDGETWHISNASVSHAYQENGSYTIWLKVTDDDDATDVTKICISVNRGISNIAPNANFSWNPESPTDLDMIQFMDNSFDDGSIVSWNWDFGDGNDSKEKNPFHRYDDNGIYRVNLTIKDDMDAIGISSKEIIVLNVEPIVDFSWEPGSPKIGEKISFMDNSFDDDGSIISWNWDFGDGNDSKEKNPFHQYAKYGSYEVRLTVVDDDGVINEKMKQIKISKNETPAFNPALFIMAFFISMLIIKSRKKFKRWKM